MKSECPIWIRHRMMWIVVWLWLLLCIWRSHSTQDIDHGSGEPDLIVTLDPERECQPIDLAFVMDSSGSINDDHPDNFNKMKKFLLDMVEMLPRLIGPGRMDNRIAVVTYSALTYMEFTFNDGTDPFVVENMIDSIRYRGSETSIAGGLELALNDLFVASAGDRLEAADVIVLITDGKGNMREDDEVPLADAAKARNISIITVGITDKVDHNRLTEMATERAFVMIDNFDALETMTQTILEFACTPPEIVETTTTKLPETSTEVPVQTTEVPIQTTEVPVQTTRTAIAVEHVLCGDVYLVILMDTSESLTDDLDKSKSSILSILDFLDKDALNVKVFTFSEHVHLECDVSQENRPELSDVINNVKPSYGRTDLATSLDFVHKRGFDKTKTENVTSILLVLSDGYSNLNTNKVLKMAKNLKNDDIHIISVSVSEHVNIEILQEISSSYSVHHSKYGNYRAVSEIFQTTCEVKAKSCERLDIVFVADSSGSINDMAPTNFQLVKNFIINFTTLQQLGAYSTQIGMATFSTYGRYEFFLSEGRNLSDLTRKIAAVRYLGGSTNTVDGLRVARNQIFHGSGTRKSAQKVLVLITDGLTEVDVEDIAEEINLLKHEGVYVVTAGFTTWSNKEYLRHLSSNSQVLQVPDHMGLNQVVLDFVDASCSQDNACSGSDVIFVIDSSWSMTDQQENSWNLTLEFVKQVVINLVIEPSHGSQVSMITFSTHGRVEFSLQEGIMQDKVLDMIDGIEYKGGKTNLADGLELARMEGGFGRVWACDVIVLLTNGAANERLEDTDYQAMKAHEEGAYIIGLGVTDAVDEESLRHLSDVYYTVKDFNDLQKLVSSVLSSICTRAN